MHPTAVEDLSTPFALLEERPNRRHRLEVLLVLGGAVIGSAFTWAALASRAPAPALFASQPSQQSPPENIARCLQHGGGVKTTVCNMDHALVALPRHVTFDSFSQAMQPFWTPDFVYSPMHALQESTGMRGWWDNEMTAWSDAFPWVSFQQMIFLGSGPNATSTTFAVGTWERPLGLLQPTKRRMTVRITDFYAASPDGRIQHNWMMIDVLDLLRQQGLAPLPLSPLPQGRVSPPQGDAIPAPLHHYSVHEDDQEARHVVSAMLRRDWLEGSEELEHWSQDMVWYGPVPFGMAIGHKAYLEHFLQPLHAAFAARALNIDVFACEGEYCAARGVFSADHVGEWLGHGASGLRLSLDFGMHWRVQDRRIVEAWAIFDLPKQFLALGVDLLAPPQQSDAPAPAAAPLATEDAPPPHDNNECSSGFARPPAGAAQLDCPAFVIKSTDATWHPRSWEATSAAVDTYFSEDWQSVRAFGLMLHGREALREFMADWLGGFPDVFIHVADVFCEGNDDAGYKTTMPYVLTATHTGWSKAFGAPTGSAVKYHGIANCFIKRSAAGQWQYTREWDLPDMWAFMSSLNRSVTQMPHPRADLVPVDECKPLFEWGSGDMNWFPPPE